jgi:cell division septum initiation protein DivIVA
MDYNERMTVRVCEYLGLVEDNKKLREKVEQLEEEIKRFTASGSADAAIR